jgi:hypothetical protein
MKGQSGRARVFVEVKWQRGLTQARLRPFPVAFGAVQAAHAQPYQGIVQRTFDNLRRKSLVHQFDEFYHRVVASRTLKGAQVVTGLVRLNSCKPHICAAFSTLRFFDFVTHYDPALL